jgi:Mitochondrial ATP synthase g subunit
VHSDKELFPGVTVLNTNQYRPHSCHSTYYLLLTSWLGAQQARISAPEDDTTVSSYIPAGPLSYSSATVINTETRSISTFQAYLQPVINAAKNPSSLLKSAESTASSAASSAAKDPNSIIDRVRNVSTAQVVAVGVLGAETLGFFTVGEMLGRFKVVGYRGETHGGH